MPSTEVGRPWAADLVLRQRSRQRDRDPELRDLQAGAVSWGLSWALECV